VRKYTIYVQAEDNFDALQYLREWAEDLASLTCYPNFPRTAEWHCTSRSGAVELKALVEEAP
jgi:hypothetical protein